MQVEHSLELVWHDAVKNLSCFSSLVMRPRCAFVPSWLTLPCLGCSEVTCHWMTCGRRCRTTTVSFSLTKLPTISGVLLSMFELKWASSDTWVYCETKKEQLVIVIWHKATLLPHMDVGPYTLQWATPSPKTVCPFIWLGSGPPSNLHPKRHLNQINHCRRAHDHDRWTYHATPSLTIGHIYTVFQKTATLFFGHNFGKWTPIFTFLSLWDSTGNFL